MDARRSAEGLARLAGVHVSTARRWRRNSPPPHVARCLDLLDGELGALCPAWRGWILRRGELISPEGVTFTPGEVRASRHDEALVRDLRRELEAATQAILSAQERRELRAALVHAQDALAAAAAATFSLVDGLTEPERQHVHEELASTRAARGRAVTPVTAPQARHGYLAIPKTEGPPCSGP